MNGVVGGIPEKARWALRSVVVLVCAVALLAAAGGQALAKSKKPKPKKPTINTHTPITRGSTYLALGDSVTFGFEEPTVVPAPNYAVASTFLGYPELLGSELHVNVVNAACPGETSASLVDSTQPSNGCESSPSPGGPFYRQNPLHVSYSGSQLAFAVGYLKKHHSVRLVSLMIGANDFFLCQETTADHCTALNEQAAVIAALGKNVKTIVSAIRNKAKYRGQLAIVNYYSLDYSSQISNTQTALLNQTVDTAASSAHVVVADGFGELEAAALHSGGSTCKAGLLTQLSSGGCGVHPSLAGQSLLAEALEKVVRLP
jgi:lysophospholipase L1-like esterase